MMIFVVFIGNTSLIADMLKIRLCLAYDYANVITQQYFDANLILEW